MRRPYRSRIGRTRNADNFRVMAEQQAKKEAADLRERIAAQDAADAAEHERRLRSDLGYRMRWIRNGKKSI